ncbi:YkgB family protein [Dyadobacter arcticus]|uniref:Membrane protein YkgB n=1 Tax=Dyadobacter arcticus TaxID=1078754 RepID=A0ABX0UM64_9BACT|nr:DUF417 family protein [Dyadobacter arcticus]NIJ52535.1 putative membrane protein YkgB [Dyadobacter arcticus]
MKNTTLPVDFPNDARLENIGTQLIRYGLAIVFIWIGILKFTTYEAAGIKPLVEHSPLLSWTYNFLSVTSFSGLLGFIEIVIGILIVCRPFSPKASALGSIAAVLTFVITLTFMISTPGVIQEGYGFPFLSALPGQFLAKDVVLLGASVWSAGEALAASRGLILRTNT